MKKRQKNLKNEFTKKKQKKKHYWLHPISNFPSQKVVHTLPNILVEACFFNCEQIDTRRPGHGHICNMFLIRLLEKEYKVLVALHHHEVWIV